jgi:methionyl-tRNA formyltransferase
VRVAYLGNDRRSVPPLRALLGSRHEVVLVITRDPRPAGRGGRERATVVADAARDRGLPLLETPTVKGGEGLDRLRAAGSDALVVVAYGEILPAEVLAIPRIAPLNVHFSLLPTLRGADPVRRAILEGLDRTGVTTIRMDEGMDTGPILLQVEEPIRDEDDAGSLGARLAEVGGGLLVETLDGLEAGTVQERPQRGVATVAPKLRPEEEWIDWTEPAEVVWRRVRALAPDPGVRTRYRGRVVKVARVRPDRGEGRPGTVVEVSKHRLIVGCGRGAVTLEHVVPEGRTGMSGPEFARGRGVAIGDRFG